MIDTGRRGIFAGIALLLSLAAIYWYTTRPGQDWGGDFAQYINGARNLAQGRPYAETSYVAAFRDSEIHMPPLYPPVFPLMLAPVYARFGLDYRAMKVLTGLLFVGAAWFTFLIARMRGLSAWLAAMAAFGFGASALALDVKERIVSDGAYLFWAGACLAAAIAAARHGWDRKRPLAAAALVLAPMLLAYGSRPTGLALGLAFAASEAIRKRRPDRFNLAVLAGFCAGVWLYSHFIYDSRDAYQSQFQFQPRLYAANILFYLHAPAAAWAGVPAILRYTLVAVTLIPALAGWFHRLWREPSILELYLPISLFPLLVYTSAPTTRYFLPLLAFYFLYDFEALQALARRVPSASWLPAAGCAALVLGSAGVLHGLDRGPYAQGVEQPTFRSLCDYLDRETDREDLIVSWNPRVLALYTGRRAAWYPERSTPDELEAYLRSVHARYVLIYSGNPGDDVLRSFLKSRPAGEFVAAFVNPDFALYRTAGDR